MTVRPGDVSRPNTPDSRMAVLMDDLRSLAKTAIEALDDESLLANRDLALRVEATDQTEMLTLWQVKALIDAEIRKRGL